MQAGNAGLGGSVIGNAWTQVGVLLFVLTFLAKPLGRYIARIARGDLPGPLRRLAAIEYVIDRLAGSMLVSTVVLVTLVTFLPALALAPIAEHLAMVAGR